LALVTTHRGKQSPHGLAFNTFGNHAQAHVVPQVDGRTHDLAVVNIAFHVHDKGLVYLEFLDRQALQVR
jgi:hypothetical protein